MAIFDFERFCENLKNGSIDFFKTFSIVLDDVNNFITESYQRLFTGTLLDLTLKRTYEPKEKLALQVTVGK